ncbi:MAG TPA: hypothetical protein GYA08_14555 [Chloroflexi bacterium]|nr:hypothetical protein [Chloroflexota bacterium]
MTYKNRTRILMWLGLLIVSVVLIYADRQQPLSNRLLVSVQHSFNSLKKTFDSVSFTMQAQMPSPLVLSEQPVEPFLSPIPTPTLLPAGTGIELAGVQDLSNAAEITLSISETPRFIKPATDGETLVGVAVEDRGAKTWGTLLAIDLASGQAQRIAGVTDVAAPQVSSDAIVWTDENRLHIYDRAKGQIETLQIGALARSPDMSGSVVVWEYMESLNTSGKRGIWAYDLDARQNFPVVFGAVQRPLVSNRWVVYRNWDKSDELTVPIDATDLDTGETVEVGRQIWSGKEYVETDSYAIDEKWVAWTSNEWAYTQGLHLFNLETRQSYTATIESCGLSELYPGRLQNLAISAGKVYFRGCYQPLGYDIQQKQFFSLPVEQTVSQYSGFVDWAFGGDKVILVALTGTDSANQTRIFAATIANATP